MAGADAEVRARVCVSAGKDLTWWNKKKKMSREDRLAEMKRVREAEEDMMREAMYVRGSCCAGFVCRVARWLCVFDARSARRGLPPKHDKPTPKLSKDDMKMALQRGGTERDEYDAGERVEGLGLAPCVVAPHHRPWAPLLSSHSLGCPVSRPWDRSRTA